MVIAGRKASITFAKNVAEGRTNKMRIDDDCGGTNQDYCAVRLAGTQLSHCTADYLLSYYKN